MDLYLAFIHRLDGMIGRARYNSEAFNIDDSITYMLSNLETLLETFTSNPQWHLSDLPDLIERGRG
jgi:hypothetical protein